MKGYFHPVTPEEHPLFLRRHAKAVTRDRLGKTPLFVALRSFDTDENGRLINIAETLDTYTKEFKLCDVIWPVYPTLFAENFDELVAEVKKRGMFMFDFWGYVPGSCRTKDNMWGEYTPPEAAVKALYGEMGDLFIGFDNGEQDGRYIGSYAPLMCPVSGSRKESYKNFCRHFEKLEGHMKNDIALLASLNFLHYFAKGGNTIILGAETAQALPNINMWFSYIRGAGKQYGLLWFGNASVWNRWGWKEYNREDGSNPYEECGPECGTSLSLLKRAIYTEYMYNSDLIGFEGGWLLEQKHLLDEKYTKKGQSHSMSPIGIIQENLADFVKRHPTPGVMHTPLCLYMDYYNGFVPPRHLYSRDIYRVWGNRSYDQGDFQVHTLFDMLYPRYEDAGFFRDETGFLTATPYGDIADVIFSDSDPAVLDRYSMIVACGDGAINAKSRADIIKAAKHGNTVVLFSGKLEKADELFLSECGIASLGEAVECHEAVVSGNETYPDTVFTVSSCTVTDATVIAKTSSGVPVILKKACGEGVIITVLLPFGLLTPENTMFSRENKEDCRIEMPYQMHPAVKALLGGMFDGLSPIRVDNRALQYSTNFLEPGRMTLLVCNNTGAEEAFSIVGSNITAVSEWDICDITPDFPGFTPKAQYLKEEASHQIKGDYRIPPRELRIFEVAFDPSAISEKPLAPFIEPPKTPLYLTLSPGKTIRDAYWDLPWFDSCFTGVKLDARMVERLDDSFLNSEGEFMRLHKLDAILDFSSMINHYPDLSFVRNISGRTEESVSRIGEILRKGTLLGCTKAVFTIHRVPENAMTAEEAKANIIKTLDEVAGIAEKYGIRLYLQNGRSLARTVFDKSSEAFEFAGSRFGRIYNLSHGLGAGEEPVTAKESGASGIFLSAPRKDCFGQFSDLHMPLCKADISGLAGQLAQICKDMEFICLDSCYQNDDEIYNDLVMLGIAEA